MFTGIPAETPRRATRLCESRVYLFDGSIGSGLDSGQNLRFDCKASRDVGPNGIRLLEPESDRPRYREGISERRAARIAQREGMDEIDSVSRRRNVYIVRGVDRYDDEMRVVIDRYSGEVLQVR